MITKVFADNIKRLRKDRGLTQTELADIIGISLASIQGYEAERVWPAMDTVKSLAKALKVTESELFLDPNYRDVQVNQALETLLKAYKPKAHPLDDLPQEILALLAIFPRDRLPSLKIALETGIQVSSEAKPKRKAR